MSQWIIHNSGYMGPFTTVEVQPDRLRCDSGALVIQLDVIGAYSITSNEPAASIAAKQAKTAEAARIAQLDAQARGDTTFDGWTLDQFNTYFDAATTAQLRDALKRIAIQVVKMRRILKQRMG